jgi:hypothetical protein
MPEPPATPSSAPLHVLVHERDERLDITVAQSVVGRADLVERHRRSVSRGG